MKLVRLAVALFFVPLFALVLEPAPAAACTCMPPRPPAESFPDATAVFYGRVLGVQSVPPGSAIVNVEVRFRVEESWKGPSGPVLVVRTGRDSAMCGYSFRPDTDYLVYAHGDADRLSTTLCSRTAQSL